MNIVTIVSGVRFYGTEAGSAELGLMVVVNGNNVTEISNHGSQVLRRWLGKPRDLRAILIDLR